MSDVVELVSAIASQLLRDPRAHPRRGDVVDDDPPLVPLTVVEVWPNEEAPRVVVGERRTFSFGHPWSSAGGWEPLRGGTRRCANEDCVRGRLLVTPKSSRPILTPVDCAPAPEQSCCNCASTAPQSPNDY